MATIGALAGIYRWWAGAGALERYEALTAAIESDEWGAHADCDALTACRAPLHPGPCKGWKHTLHLVSPGAWKALEQNRVDKLNHKRLAKIAQLKAEGKKIPPALLKTIMPKPNPGTPPPGWHPGDLAPGQPAHLADKHIEQAVSQVGQKAAQAKGAAHKALHAESHTIAEHATAKGGTVGAPSAAIKAGTASNEEALAHVAKVVAEHPVAAEPVKFPGTQTLAEKAMAQHLIDVVGLSKKGTPTDKLAGYGKITAESWAKLSPEVQTKIKNDLTLMEGKFKSTYANVKVFAVQDKIKAFDEKKGIPGKEVHGKAVKIPEPRKAPEAPQAINVKTAEPSIAPALAPTGKTLGGTHGAVQLKDDKGNLYAFKPVGPSDLMTAHAEAGANKLARKVGLAAPVTTVTTHDGKTGSLQQFIDGKPAFGGKHLDPAKLTDADVLAIQKQHVLDWLTGNHDAHGGQWIRTPDGKLVEIDKAQSFKHYGSDKLSPDYHPNAKFGEVAPVYNQLYQAAQAGKVQLNDPSGGELHDFIAKVQDVPGEDIKAMFRPYAEAAHAAGKLPTGETVDGFLNKIVARKNNLDKDFAGLHASLPHKGEADVAHEAKVSAEETKAANAEPSTPGKLSIAALHAKTVAEKPGFTMSKAHLEAYAPLSAAEFHALPESTQVKMKADLETAKAKLKDQKKIKLVHDTLAKWEAGKPAEAAPEKPAEPATAATGLLKPWPGYEQMTGDAKFVHAYHVESTNGVEEGSKWLALTPAEYAALPKTSQADASNSLESLIDTGQSEFTDAQKKQLQAHWHAWQSATLTSQGKTPMGSGVADKTLADVGIDLTGDEYQGLSDHGKMIYLGNLSKEQAGELTGAEKQKYVAELTKLKAGASAGLAAELDKVAKFHGVTLPEKSAAPTSPLTSQAAMKAEPTIPQVAAKIEGENLAKATLDKIDNAALYQQKHQAVAELTKDQYDSLPIGAQAKIAELTQAGIDKHASSNKAGQASVPAANAEKFWGGADKVPEQLVNYQKLTDALWPNGQGGAVNVTPGESTTSALFAIDKATWEVADPAVREAAAAALHNTYVSASGPAKKEALEKVADKLGVDLPKPEAVGAEPSTAEIVAKAKAATWTPSEPMLDAVAKGAGTTQAKVGKDAFFYGTGNNYSKYQTLAAASKADPTASEALAALNAAAREHAKAHARWRAAVHYRDNLVAAGGKLGTPEVSKADQDALGARVEFDKADKAYRAAHKAFQAKSDALRATAGLTKRKIPLYYEGKSADLLQQNVAGNIHPTALSGAPAAELHMPFQQKYAVAPHLLPGTYSKNKDVEGLGGATPLGAEKTGPALKPAPKVTAPINAKKAPPPPTYSSSGYGYSYPHPNPAEGVLPDSTFVAGHGITTGNDHGADPFAGKDAYVTSAAEAEALNALHGQTLKGSAAHAAHVAIPDIKNDAVKTMVKSYTGSTYHTINKALTNYAKTGKWEGPDHDAAKIIYDGFQDGSIPKLDHSITVYRGFSNGPEIIGPDAWGPNMTGTTFTYHPASSTSTFFGKAKGFSGANGKNSVVMRIHVPAGTATVSAAAGGHFNSEKEFLLGPNTQYKIVADYGWHDGVRMIDVEVVPNAHTASAYRRGSGIPPRTIAEFAHALGK